MKVAIAIAPHSRAALLDCPESSNFFVICPVR
jgi:hypothetical protein